MKIHKSKLATFGGQVEQYEKGRSGYPKEVFQFFKSTVKHKKPLILDLGCGTGISTRQLTKFGTVVGADPDPVMLRAARRHKNSGVKKYILARANKLPFGDETFDVVTAFSAFHWFDDKKSVKEIRRVLKDGGVFFLANKPGIRSWGQGYRRAISKSIGRPTADFVTAKNWQPKKIVESSGFKSVKFREWKKSETYSLPRAIEYIQSVSIWNSIPIKLRTIALEGLREHFQKIKKRFGRIERRYRVLVVAGFK